MISEKIRAIAQKCFSNTPTLVLGSGTSIPHGLPSMEKLGNYIITYIKITGRDEKRKWLPVQKALENGNHLEAALEGINLPKKLLSKIVELTWACVNEKDTALYRMLYKNPSADPLGQLLSALFNSTRNSLDVVTTNYDRVIEYACNSARLLYQTGFAPGYLQNWESTSGVTYRKGQKNARVVKIWKVHGSLDWFQTADDQVIGLPLFCLPSNELTPLIVTPGLNKYEKTSEDPFRTTMTGADNALKSAGAFLCAGFGFRDKHIHPKIVERCREKNVPIVLLGKTLTEEAKLFLKKKAGSNYLGIEAADQESRVYTSEFPDGININESNLWSLEGFNTLVI